MFSSMSEKFLHFIRNARYPFARNKLFTINSDGDLCACALGQVALGVGIIDEETARKSVKDEGGNPASVYNALRERFGTWTDRVPGINDSSTMSSTLTGIESAKQFEKIADAIVQSGILPVEPA